jgi:hypothetical protein
MKDPMKYIAFSLIFLLVSVVHSFADVDSLWNPFLKGDRHVRLSIMRILNFSVEPDEDRNEIDNGIEFEHQLESGNGYGLGIELFMVDSEDGSWDDIAGINMGLLYLTTTHEENQSRESVGTHSIYFEGILRASQTLISNLTIHEGLYGGLGFVTLDFRDDLNDSTSAAAEVRARLGVEFFNHIEVAICGGSYLWGYPSETVGYGSFFSVEASLIF